MTDLSKLKWTDTSTADPVEKARRVLNHLIEPDGAFFFQDGYPRSNDIAMNAASVLAVLNALSASIADTACSDDRERTAFIESYGDTPDDVPLIWNAFRMGHRAAMSSIANTAGAKPVMWVILDKDGDLVGQSMTPMKGLDWEPLFRAAPTAPSVADAFPYQKTFDAIAAATTGYGEGYVGISVIKFREAFGAPSVADAAGADDWRNAARGAVSHLDYETDAPSNVKAALRQLRDAMLAPADTAGAALYHPLLGGVANSANAANVAAGIANTAGAKPVMWVILDKDGDLVGQSMTPMKGLDWEPLFRAAPPAPSVADAAGASEDKALLDYLDNEENPVDTIYFDDGKIIDVAGRRTVREAIRAAIAKESGK